MIWYMLSINNELYIVSNSQSANGLCTQLIPNMWRGVSTSFRSLDRIADLESASSNTWQLVWGVFDLSVFFPLANRHRDGVWGWGAQLGVYDLPRGKKTVELRIYFWDFIGLSTDKDIISQEISTIWRQVSNIFSWATYINCDCFKRISFMRGCTPW